MDRSTETQLLADHGRRHCGVAVLLDGFDAQIIGFVAPAIIAEFKVQPQLLARVFSAGLVGILVGCLFLSPLADWLGRRWVMIVSALVFALATLATAWAGSLDELMILRFLTGHEPFRAGEGTGRRACPLKKHRSAGQTDLQGLRCRTRLQDRREIVMERDELQSGDVAMFNRDFQCDGSRFPAGTECVIVAHLESQDYKVQVLEPKNEVILVPEAILDPVQP